MANKATTNARERQNGRIHSLYITHDFDECLAVIEDQLRQSAFCEYPLYIKGLIFRRQGRVAESLPLFQTAACLNPRNTANLKEVATTLSLLGKPRQALEVFAQARSIPIETARARGGPPPQEDWEILHGTGMCYLQQQQFDTAIDCFRKANEVGVDICRRNGIGSFSVDPRRPPLCPALL